MNTSKQARRRTPAFQASLVEAVAAILGDTDHGLTNSEIDKVLAGAKLPDPRKRAEATDPRVRQGLGYIAMSKRDRISQAVLLQQSEQGDGRSLVGLINEAMQPDGPWGCAAANRQIPGETAHV